jgi:putative methyltransferase (TIGR04325 family)
MSSNASGWGLYRLRQSLIRAATDVGQLPGMHVIAEPLYRRYFKRPCHRGNLYYGIFESYDDALAQAEQLASTDLPASYDVDGAARKYRAQLETLRACDYPSLYWLRQILEAGERKVFDLGGHLGLAYYGYKRYLSYPHDLCWHVHDLPRVMAAGRTLANERGCSGALQFVESPSDADGADVLISTGALQYLHYRLPTLIQRLRKPPRHVIFNLTPLHDSKSFFTLQNLGIAICPYRIDHAPTLFNDMGNLGYRVRDHWTLADRRIRIPFAAAYSVDQYHGCYLELTSS